MTAFPSPDGPVSFPCMHTKDSKKNKQVLLTPLPAPRLEEALAASPHMSQPLGRSLPLHRAAKSGDADRVASLLESGRNDPAARDEQVGRMCLPHVQYLSNI